MMKRRYLAAEEMDAIEVAARRVRVAEVARLFQAGASAFKSLFACAVAALSAKAAPHA